MFDGFTLVIPEIKLPKFTNQNLLEMSMLLFFVFAMAEIFGAITSNSLSLLGDAASMSVDVCSYGCNIYGEWAKNNNWRATVRSRLVLEVAIPSISAIALLAVTVYITFDASSVLMHPPLKNDVYTNYLYGYSAVNLLVDAFCGYLFFSRGDDVFIEDSEIPQLSLDTSIHFDEEDEFGHLDDDFDLITRRVNSDSNGGVCCSNFTNLWASFFSMPTRRSTISECNVCCCITSQYFRCFSSSISHGNSSPDEATQGMYMQVATNSHSKNNNCTTDSDTINSPTEKPKNLNMMSAFIHIIGDTLRTVAMFFAAAVASITGIDGDICDAYSALIVAITIFILCAVLIHDIWCAALVIYNDENTNKTGQMPTHRR